MSLTNLRDNTLVELLRWRAQQQSAQLAHTFLTDKTTQDTLTYEQLDQQARSIAARLQSSNANGERVLLLYPPGLEFISAFFGCLYAGAIAVPVYPPRRNRNLLRLLAIVKDSEASIAMTTATVLERMKPWFAETPQLNNLRWIASDSLDDQSEQDWQEPGVERHSLAFLQYTSGSTGKPKGVMLTHENLLFNAALVYAAVDHAPGDRYVSWLPTFHDMGFMAGILQPLYGGFESVLMSPATFLQRPLSWLEAITHYRATTSGAPNFAYELCVRKTNAEQRATLDLSSWTVAFNGAEPIRIETLERFVAAFGPCGFRREAFYPCYGLAEATLMVAGSVKTNVPVSKRVSAKALLDHRVVESVEKNARVLVGCGRNLGSQKICIVHPDSYLECAPGEVGEIWVAGTSVAQGYWRKPELTKETFGAHLSGTGEGPFLRTGDLGFIDAGELFVTGRLKDLVIIRGFNHYPQDIELTVERCHPALRPGCGAAFSVEIEDEERLVVVHEVDQRVEVDLNALRERVISAIAEEHELQTYAVVFIAQGSVSKTSSGKIQRHACQAGFLNQSLEIMAEWRHDLTRDAAIDRSLQEIGDIETWLKQEIGRTLKLPASQVDPEKPLAQYGLDSLGALELIYSLEAATGVNLSLASFLQEFSIRDLAAEIQSAAVSTPLATSSAVDESDQPLSRGQQALWFLHCLAPESAAYNIAGAVRIVGSVDADVLRRSFQALIDRHPSLRTTYHELNGKPVQRVYGHAAVSFHEEDAASWSRAELDQRLEQEAQAPFDLETGPPVRVSLFRLSSTEHVLLLVVHHIVTDFWSLAILVHELGLLYRGQTLAPLPLQYADYVGRQEQMLNSAEGERLWTYWQKQLAGELLVVDLPTDRPRPPVQTFNGASHAFKIDSALTERLKAVARDHGATLYMLLLASFQMLLHRYTGQEDILVGSPAAGRGRADLAGLVGYFVNPLVLRADFSGNPTLGRFLDQVRRTVLDAYRHQDYPFALLVEKLQPDRDPARSPLFQVMFTFHQSHLRDENLALFALGEAGVRMNAGGLELESVAFDQRVAQFDVTLMMAEASDGLVASLQYNRDLFDHRTIEYMAQHFETLLRSVVDADETARVRELRWLGESEREEIVYGWNETEAEVESELSIAEEIAARAGEDVALVCGAEELSYAELNARANQLGRYLQGLGVGPETVVGVCLERSIELVVALLGVLKAGGAYLPLDPAYPRERLEWMLSDAGAQVVLTEETLREVRGESCEELQSAVSDENLAYVIYTSGSTGRPKGVMVQQGNVKNFFRGMDQSLSNGSADGKRETWLAVTSVSFDISVLELLWSLRRGSRVVLQSEQRELAREESEARELEFSLFYFAATSASNGHGSYQLLLEGARYADAHGYKAVWTPERHFHEFGGLYPNPSVTSAALATITERVELRAGSVVLPLHNPLRVAEEWSVIDNLSGGRVGVSFASGWHADDFVLAPENYAQRQRVMEEGIELVRRLWRGEGARLRGGSGQEVEVRIQPRPVQAELPVWVTAAGALETFRQAGRLGASVLTHLLGQSVEELAAKVQAYREAWREAGHAGRGHVTLMLHTFVGSEDAEVKRVVRAPMLQYLSSSLGLIERLAKSLGKDLGGAQLSGADYDEVLEYAFERYYERSGLLGTVDKCVAMAQRLRRSGIDEVACLIDFGPGVDDVLESLRYLEEVRRRLARSIPIAEQLQKHRVTHLQCTPTLASALWQEAKTRAGLSKLEQLLCGGEALPGSLAGALRETVAGAVYNMYGPTETTIWSATHEVNETDAETPIVSLGRPIANTQLYLLDEALQPVPVGVRGELYIGGDGVARGYWKRGELTAERFVPDPFSRRGGQRLYRTGDEARYIANGEIEYLGRSDQQVKLRGFRIELGEIEAALREHESVTSAAVAVRGERLVAYVVGQTIDGNVLRQHLQQRLPDYMVPSYYMNLTALPQTPNGKLDRKALPEPEPGTIGTEYEAPRTPVEEVLAAIIAEVLGVARVGRHDDFFALGGHSLLAMQVISRIREAFQVELPVRVLFESPTLAGLGGYLSGAAKVEAPPLRRLDRTQPLPLSFAQQRLWFLDRFEADRHIYNVPVRVELRGALNHQRLEKSLNQLLLRHEVLRSSFREVDGQPIQQVSEALTLELPLLDVSDSEAERIAAEEVFQPFNLEQAPLLRARLLRRTEDNHLLLLTLHHAVCDGWSLGVLLKEVAAYYEQDRLPDLPVQYADYAAWQREWLQGEVLEAQLNYWRERLQGAPAALELATDYPRPALHRYRAATLGYQLDAPLSSEMQALSRREGVTLLMLLLASLQLLLSRYTGAQDISVGLPIAGRNCVESEDLVGLFLNTLVLRTEWTGDPTFLELLAKVREVALGAYAHQELPFEKLVEELEPTRDLSRTPLFQVMLVLQNAPLQLPSLTELEVGALEVATRSTNYDLTISLTETDTGLQVLLDYNALLFKEERMQRLLRHWERLLHSIVATPNSKLSQLQWLTDAEREQLVYGWNQTEQEYDRALSVVDLIAQQPPEAVAVISGAEQLTYAELNERANRVAHYLRAQGVGPESVVGVCMERTVSLPIALLGVLKSGGAYLPLDPSYPRERLAWILEDAGVQVVLSEEPATRTNTDFKTTISSANLAYLIYTSGSTGRPKGVPVTHGNLLNFLRSMQVEPGLTAADTLVAVTTLAFDIAGLEIYLPLISGGRVVLADRETATDGQRLLKLLRESEATVMQATPATWRLLLDALENSGERLQLKVLCGGEALPGSLAKELRARIDGPIYNLYGPTETTIWSALHEVNEADAETAIVSIGSPIANTQLYLLDEALQPAPVGVRGELYIGGEGVARGYWNSSELTAARFVPDPFSRGGGQRLYRTGDEARYLANGEIEYLGRSDQQVKLRGYRIELGEIEAALREHESVTSAAVAVRGERLVAYVVGPAIDGNVLRQHLQQRLPDYMAPSYYMNLVALPQTPNGKFDRKALPEPEPSATGTEYEAPRTPVEEVLSAIVAEVLQVPLVGRQDDFFALGGHSLLASQLLFRLQKAFRVDLSLLSIFQTPKIADLAAHVSSLQTSEALPEFPTIKPDPIKRHEPFSLTDVQQAYWVGRASLFELGNVATHIAVEIESTGLDIERLNFALQRLITRHEMLRAIVLPDGRQQILESVPLYQIETLDLRDLSPEAKAAKLEEVRESMSHQVLRADQWPLFEIRASQLDDQTTRIHLSFDLLIGDARSFQIISQELHELYDNPDQTVDTFELSFRDYVLAETQLQESPLYRGSEQYWMDRLPALSPAPDLPLAKIPNTITKPRFVRRYGALPTDLWQQLKQRAARAGVTPSGVLLAAFAEILTTWSKSPKFTINLTLFNRLPLHEQVNDIVGDFTSLTLLAVDNSELADFETRARQIQSQLWSDMDHRYMSGVRVLRELARAQGGKAGATMPVVFTSMLSLQSPENAAGWSLNWLGKQVYGISQTPQVWLDHQAFEDGGTLGFNWDAVEELFPEGLLDDMFDAYLRLLHSLAESDAQWQATARELIPARQLSQRAAINATAAPITDELLHTLFAAVVDQQSNLPAVIHTDRVLTYQELFAQSNQLAHRLRRLGARPNRLVAVVMEKGWEQTVAVLGILQAGAAYLPIEATLPAERINYLLAQGEAEIVITQPWLDQKLGWPDDIHQNIHRICIGSEELATESVEPLPSVQCPEDLAYVIFTSGSTGQPKGVMIDHRGAVNTVLDINKRFNVGPSDRVLALSSLSFDLSVYDIFGMLAAGGTIVVPEAASRRDPKHWADMVARHRVTIWNSVPALMNIQVDHLSERGRESLESLRLVMMSGDWIPVSLPDRIKGLIDGVEVVSLGGATEASIWSILYPIEEVDPSWKSIPYGRPMWNQSFHVLDSHLEPCPVWTIGELYIGGIGLAKGYWRDEQKTNRSFITHPRSGERLYRTGDLGRYLPDGNIEFLGREDSQVKIQGYRIELGEIEAALEEHEGVRAAVVNACGEQRGSKRLIGYVVPEQNAPTTAELQQHLKTKLPEYMIPQTFMFLDKLPLSSNGKVDRRALPEPERVQQHEATLAAPGNWKEQALVEIWTKVLGVEQVGINDNFFELGGDSILSIRAAAQASEAGLRLTPDQIFQYRTIAALSAVVGWDPLESTCRHASLSIL